MRENIITLRVRNAKLERALASKSARNAIRRIRTELTRRGLNMAQREGILHDSLLLVAECEAVGGDPIEALLGTSNVSSYDTAIDSFCDGVASECSRLPTALVIMRFSPCLSWRCPQCLPFIWHIVLDVAPQAVGFPVIW